MVVDAVPSECLGFLNSLPFLRNSEFHLASLNGFTAAEAIFLSFSWTLSLFFFSIFFPSQLLFVLPPSQQLVSLHILLGVYSPWI